MSGSPVTEVNKKVRKTFAEALARQKAILQQDADLGIHPRATREDPLIQQERKALADAMRAEKKELKALSKPPVKDNPTPEFITLKAERMAYLKEKGITPPAPPVVTGQGKVSWVESFFYNRRLSNFEKEYFADLQPPKSFLQKAWKPVATFALIASPVGDGLFNEPGKMNPLTTAEHTFVNFIEGAQTLVGQTNNPGSLITDAVYNIGAATRGSFAEQAEKNAADNAFAMAPGMRETVKVGPKTVADNIGEQARKSVAPDLKKAQEAAAAASAAGAKVTALKREAKQGAYDARMGIMDEVGSEPSPTPR